MNNATANPAENNARRRAVEIIPFDFGKQRVRTLLVDEQPWFVVVDVCESLAIVNTARALSRLDEDERGVHSMNTLGGIQNLSIINESGLYSLVLTSRKVEAKRFKKWVTAEVLPAIRKHGRYEDRTGKMGTLIGQTIGKDGFHMLGAVVKGKVSGLPASAQRRATAKIWSQIHAAFGVRSAADIPAEQLDAARNFIAAYLVLEGEYLAKQTEGGMKFNKHEAQDIYLLMSYMSVLFRHRENLLQAARALSSKHLMEVGSMIGEARISFGSLDKRRKELYKNYRSLGMDGGYAMGGAA